MVHGVNGQMMEKYYVIGAALMALCITIPPYAAGEYGYGVSISLLHLNAVLITAFCVILDGILKKLVVGIRAMRRASVWRGWYVRFCNGLHLRLTTAAFSSGRHAGVLDRFDRFRRSPRIEHCLDPPYPPPSMFVSSLSLTVIVTNNALFRLLRYAKNASSAPSPILRSRLKNTPVTPAVPATATTLHPHSRRLIPPTSEIKITAAATIMG